MDHVLCTQTFWESCCLMTLYEIQAEKVFAFISILPLLLPNMYLLSKTQTISLKNSVCHDWSHSKHDFSSSFHAPSITDTRMVTKNNFSTYNYRANFLDWHHIIPQFGRKNEPFVQCQSLVIVSAKHFKNMRFAIPDKIHCLLSFCIFCNQNQVESFHSAIQHINPFVLSLWHLILQISISLAAIGFRDDSQFLFSSCWHSRRRCVWWNFNQLA